MFATGLFPIKRSRPANTLALCASLLCAAGAALPASAQTASFLYSQMDVATGLNAPQGVAVDAAGNVYIAGLGDNRVLKATLTSGTYASPIPVVSGLIRAYGVAVDSGGNLYIADQGQSGLVKESLSGGVYTPSHLGSGFNPISVAVDSSANLYAADGISNLYLETLISGLYAQSSAALTGAHGVAVDSSGNIYAALPSTHQVVKGTLVTGGYTSAPVATGLNAPAGVAVDGGGNVYITDQGAGEVYKETYSPGAGRYTQSVLATGLSAPAGVAVDSNGAVYVSDASGGGRVLKLQPSGADFGTQSVGSASTSLTVSFAVESVGTFGTPIVLTQGVQGLDFALATGSTCLGTLSAGTTCAVDITFTPRYPGSRMGAVELTNASGGVVATALVRGVGSGPQIGFTPGSISTFAGNGTACSPPTGACGDGGAAVSANLHNPDDMVLDGAGNLYIADTNSYRIRKVSAAGVMSTYAGTGVAGYRASDDGGPAIDAELFSPGGLAVDGAGNLYIADTFNEMIREVVAATGDIVRVAGTGTPGSSGDGAAATSALLDHPFGVAVDGAGNLYVADTYNNVIRKITASTGAITRVAGNYAPGFSGDGGTATSAALCQPYGVALDSDSNMYIADSMNARIREVSALTGVIDTVAGNGSAGFSGDGASATSAELSFPTRARVDAAGSIYVADYANERIRKVAKATGSISTLAGTGAASSTGDGGAATSAAINGPFTVTADSAGNLYIADSTGNRIRAITAAAAPLTFASTAVGGASSDSPQTVILSNDGNTNLTFPPPASAGAENPSISANFTYGPSSTCTQIGFSAASFVLPGGASCTEVISFTPLIAGTISGAVAQADDSLNVAGATQSVALHGTGASATPAVSVASISSAYGATVTLGAAISYPGTAPVGAVTFTIGAAPPTAKPGSCAAASGTRTCTATYTNLSLTPGSYSIQVTEAADSNYNAASGTGILTLTSALPTVTVTSQSVPYGTATATLTALVAYSGSGAPTGILTFAVAGGAPVAATCGGSSSPLTCSATYPTSALGAGSQRISASLAADTNYTPASATGTLSVSQATPVITWTTPAGIPYGTPLDATQLAATASVAGSFTYTPAAGTVLPAGTQILTATFTPSDTTDYTTASQTVRLLVIPFAAQPILSPGSGSYASAQTVTIADATPGAAIYYTIDGSIPTPASARYTAPLTIASTQTIEAIATATGYETSLVSVAAITIDRPPVCTLSVQGASTALHVIALASCSDPQGQALTTTLNWGDGTSTPAAARNSHTYASAGTYIVVLSATDTAGLTGTAQQQVTPNQLPVCSLGVAQAAASTYAVSVTVACTDPQNQPLTLTIDWGDGTDARSATNNAPNPHTYSGPNVPSTTPYTIVLTAIDTSGLDGSASQPVTIWPIAATVSPGGNSSVPVSSQAPSGTQVTAICTSVSSTINGQVVTDALPSRYGITCSAPVVTLSASTTQVNVTIQTTSAGTAAAYRPERSTAVFYALALPLPALASLALGLLRPARSRRQRQRGAALGMILILCSALSSCGGSFTPPPVVATPAGQYYITIVQVSVTSPAPTGFVQTSVIVPLPIGGGGS